MKAIHLIKVSLFIIACAMISCQKDSISISGQGSIASKTLSISDFSGIDLAEAGNVVVSQGAIQEVVATGHTNIIDRIRKEVSGDTWKIDFEKGRYKDYELTINITVPNLKSISLSGSGHITVNDFIDQSELDIDLSGSGQIDLYRFTGPKNMDVDISGSGTITGNSEIPLLQNANIKISGSGRYDGFPIMSDDCKIKMSGSGNCNVSVRNTLDVTISGSGTVYYRGNPTVMDHTNSAGHIIDAN